MTNGEIKGALAALSEAMATGFARADEETKALREAMSSGFAQADGETKALREAMSAGFARVDRYFELQQLQFVEFRDQVLDFQDQVVSRLDALTARVRPARTGVTVAAR